MIKALLLPGIFVAFFSFVAQADEDEKTLSAKNLEAACQKHLLRSEANRNDVSRAKTSKTFQIIDAEALLWAQDVARELSAHMNQEDSKTIQGKIDSPGIALKKYENIFLTQSHRHDLVTQTALHSMLLAINGQVDTIEVADILARHWKSIFEASLHFDEHLATAYYVSHFIVEFASYHVIPSLYEAYKKALGARPLKFEKSAYIAHTEFIILRLGYKYELYRKLQNSASSQAFQAVRNRYGTDDKEKKTYFYREADSFAGQLYGYFRYEASRKSSLFDSGILQLNPVEEKPSDIKDSVRVSLRFLTAETDLIMGLQSEEKTPALLYADYLSQLSTPQVLNLSPSNKRILLDSFHLDQIAPANAAIHFETLSKVYRKALELSFIWEHFLVELKKNEGGLFVPTHDDVLPLVRNVDPFIFELLILTSASPTVVRFCEKALNKAD